MGQYSANLDECYSPKYYTSSELHDPLSIQIQCIKMRIVLVVVGSLPGVTADEQTPHAPPVEMVQMDPTWGQ